MEAAIRLPITQVYVHNGRLSIDQLVVEDETVVRLASQRDDAARFVVEAIEIGARVLDRELTGANAEFVRAEFEKTARELDASFVERARRVAERLDEKVDEAFGPEHGHVTKVLARHFGDESSVAVQHRMRAVLDEVALRMREDLRRQFSSDSDANPLAGFQNAHLAATKQIAGQQAQHLLAMTDKLEAMKLEISELRSEKVRSSRRSQRSPRRARRRDARYEEAVVLAIDAIAAAQGDDCDAVGDVRGEGGRKGDVVVAIDACAGPGARADRVRGQELPAVAQQGAGRARRGARDARRGLRDLRRAVGGQAARAHARRCASSTATRCSSSTTPTTTGGWRSRSPTRSRGRGC